MVNRPVAQTPRPKTGETQKVDTRKIVTLNNHEIDNKKRNSKC